MVMFCMNSCKTTKDTAVSRTYHQMVSRFNPLFNARQTMLEAEEKLRQRHTDDYEEILSVYEVGTAEDATSIKPEMERVMEKGAKVIRNHSMLISNRQKNKYIDDAYFLIGKARYYNRDFIKALETFNYIALNYPKSAEANLNTLWIARTQIALENYSSAEKKLETLYRGNDVSDDVKVHALASYAQMELIRGNYSNASKLLNQAVDKSKKNSQKARWTFISGQLLAELGNSYESSQKFKKVLDYKPSYELAFQSKLNRARNYDVDLQDPRIVFSELRKMLKDEKNYDAKDQIYYVMAEIAERMGEDEEMLTFLKQSIRLSTVNKTQKALSYLKIGQYDFDERLYPLAAAYYDSAFAAIPKDHHRYAEIEIKATSLQKLITNINVITEQDSLQKLANLGEKTRESFVKNLILKLEEQDRQKRLEEERADNSLFVENSSSSIFSQQTASGVFYFYNQNSRSNGIREFRNTFGTRPLEDNWRRADKKMIVEEVAVGGGGIEGRPEEEGSAYDLDAMLANIPLTDSAIAVSDGLIQTAYLNLGNIYKDELKDLRQAATELETLTKRYLNFDRRARAIYVLYIIYKNLEDQAKADSYKNEILTNYPKTEFARLILNEGKEEDLTDTSDVVRVYTEAYEHYLEKKYQLSLKETEAGYKNYGKTSYGPKLILLRAYDIAKLKDQSELMVALKAVKDRYPGTPEAAKALEILAQLSLDDPDEPADNKKEKELYKFNMSEEHKFILFVPNKGVDMTGLKGSISNFNKQYYANSNLQLQTVFLNSETQMIIVSPLSNSAEGLTYINNILNAKALNKFLAGRSFQHFVISRQNFQSFFKDQDIEKYASFYESYYKTESK